MGYRLFLTKVRDGFPLFCMIYTYFCCTLLLYQETDLEVLLELILKVLTGLAK